jgi:glycerophosphoryl diester phosphodiesterase
MPKFDRGIFLVPIAHRGLFDAPAGRIENTRAAFQAAIDSDLGIECDVRPAAGGIPVVFHDETVDRLIDGHARVADLGADDLARLQYRGQDDTILTFTELLHMVDGRVPLLVEIKSEWDPPDHAFLFRLCRMAAYYDGPIALMSFDPAVMAVVKQYAPQVPRGIVSGSYAGDGWWSDRLDAARAARLRDLEESAAAAPDFYAYEVEALATPAPRRVREELGVPLFTWTVRTPEDRALAERYADAPIFEQIGGSASVAAAGGQSSLSAA